MKMPIDKEWFEKRAAAEGDLEVGAGFSIVNPSAADIKTMERLLLESLPGWARDRITALEKENEELLKWLATIRDYPPAGGRRTADGYPMEVVYDEYAYRRIVDTYRLAARLASTERTPE